MPKPCVPIHHTPGLRNLSVREPNGLDEQFVASADTATAIELIDRLWTKPPGETDWRGGSLTAADRDQVLAAIYEITFGSKIESTARCLRCDNLFDLSFQIEDLVAVLDAAGAAPALAQRQMDGTFRLPEGIVFRLPTGDDELRVAGLPHAEAEQALLSKCLMDGAGEPIEPALVLKIQQAMEEAAPTLDLDLDAVCPECGAGQQFHFDVQLCLLNGMIQERERLIREIHRVALAYGWSLEEILSLPRSQRRRFVELIEAELPARKRVLS